VATNPKPQRVSPRPQRADKELSKQRPTPIRPLHLKRYSLVIPEDLYAELQELAAGEHTAIQDIIRRSIRLGIYAAKIAEEAGASLVVEREGQPKERILFYI